MTSTPYVSRIAFTRPRCSSLSRSQRIEGPDFFGLGLFGDFEKKFIRAEVVNWQQLVDCDGYPGARDKGILRLEGKEYIVKDGDVLVIRHG